MRVCEEIKKLETTSEIRGEDGWMDGDGGEGVFIPFSLRPNFNSVI